MISEAWIKRAVGQMYAAVVKEPIPPGFKSHVFVMLVIGEWPMVDDSRWYKWLTIAFFTSVGILYPLSMFVNLFFVNSMREVIETLFISFTCCATAIKAAIIYWRRDIIQELFHIHEDRLCGLRSNVVNNYQVARMNLRVHTILTFLYHSSIYSGLIQIMVLEPEKCFCTSTSRFPYEFAQQRTVYSAVLVYQLLNGLGAIIWVAMQDALAFAFINTVCGHVAQLKERLQRLGRENDDWLFYKNLAECCQYYEDCLRFDYRFPPFIYPFDPN